MVVAAKVVRSHLALTVIRAAKFATPDDERVVQHAAGFEIGDEGGSGLVGLLALAFDTAGQAAVVIPVLVVEQDVGIEKAGGDGGVGQAVGCGGAKDDDRVLGAEGGGEFAGAEDGVWHEMNVRRGVRSGQGRIGFLGCDRLLASGRESWKGLLTFQVSL